MNHNFVFEDINEALPRLMSAVLQGEEVGSRNGRVMELTHVGITLTHPTNREILVPGRKANLAAQIAETVWVLSGRNDIEWLSHYLPRAKDFSDDGTTWRGGYGPRIRNWQGSLTSSGVGVDQLDHVVELLKRDPLTRRAVIAIYEPGVDSAEGKDIPCNDFIVFTNRLGRLDMNVTIRSNDLMWGWSGINAFEWSALLEIVARLVGVGVGALHFNIASLHLYDQHWEKAHRLSQVSGGVNHHLAREWAGQWPRFNPHESVGNTVGGLDGLLQAWMQIEESIRKGGGRYGGGGWEAQIERFPEPMLKDWLEVIAWWWHSGAKSVSPPMQTAVSMALQPKRAEEPVVAMYANGDMTIRGNVNLTGANNINTSSFLGHVFHLHRDKHNAYGDSWKRRGEMLGIMANIARKVDRLNGGETDDETSADTALDLMVYLAKYRWWLSDDDRLAQPVPVKGFVRSPETVSQWSDHVEPVEALLTQVERETQGKKVNINEIKHDLMTGFDRLEAVVNDDPDDRYVLVDALLEDSYWLAKMLWNREQWKSGNATRMWNPEAGVES